MDSLMTFVPLILVSITLATCGYMAYMVHLVITICKRAEQQTKEWNNLLGWNK